MNKELLRYEYRRRGLTAADVADRIGMHRYTFYKKCNGQREFTVSEIKSILSLLCIEDPVPIFFADEVS